MTRRHLAWLGGIVALALLFLFALYNLGQPVALSLGPLRWRGEVVFALYGGVCLGLLLMFLLGLPADLAARRERERLARRVDELERAAALTADGRSLEPRSLDPPEEEATRRAP